MSRTYTLWAILVGAVCLWFLVHLFFFPQPRLVRNDVIQGVLIGAGLAFVSAQVYARIKAKKVNGWITMYHLGDPKNSMFLRAAQAQLFLGPVNLQEEAMYWWTNSDGAGRLLTGARDYVMRFPPGGLPPNHAFWSITLGDAHNHFVPNPINRYTVSDRTGLASNPDGSVDIYIQNTAPAGHESNWLPSGAGSFLLWLRVYLPGDAILQGKYSVPPVTEARRGR